MNKICFKNRLDNPEASKTDSYSKMVKADWREKRDCWWHEEMKAADKDCEH